MNKHGKVKQVLFEKALIRNSYTGEMQETENSLQLWTDEGLNELIKKVPGVSIVTPNLGGYPTSYGIIIDPRYDIEFVKKEIEATIICEIGEI